MSTGHKLSLTSAIFINLNIMMGVGLFISTTVLSQKLGAASIFIYPLMGLLMFPLIYSTSKLINRFPKGGFYSFAKSMNPYLGFISTWSYFMGKLASGGLMLYVGCTILKEYFTFSQGVSPLYVSFAVLLLFTIFNLYNIKIGALVQQFFFGAKLIPILSVIGIGFFYFDSSGLVSQNFHFAEIPFIIPLLIFCLCGFEAACSISRKIENPEVNGPKAIFYSFGIVVLLYTFYQALLYAMTHADVNAIASYKEIYPLLTQVLPTSPMTQQKIASLFNFMSAISALGGAYGIMFSNAWNLYTLAEHEHLVFNKYFLKLNKHHIPYLVILLEGSVFVMFLLFTQGYQIPLQQTTAFGVTIAYTITAIGAFVQLKKYKGITTLAVITCLGFIASCLYSLMQQGISSLYLFLSIIAFGTFMFWYKQK